MQTLLIYGAKRRNFHCAQIALDSKRQESDEDMKQKSDVFLGDAHWQLPKVAVLATMHGKQIALQETFAAIGVDLTLPADFDTDQFGTFSGEVPRLGTMEEAARAKLAAAMSVSGISAGLVSEGAYGAHPMIPFAAAGLEILVWYDKERNYEIIEHLLDEKPVYDHCDIKRFEDLGPFLERINFPYTAVIVAPSSNKSASCGKGLRSLQDVEEAFKSAGKLSEDGTCFVQTDMRAHMNPRRMETIRCLGKTLATRLTQLCASCATPGWGLLRRQAGLPCKWCGEASMQIAYEIHGCIACGEEKIVPRSDGKTHADPAHCDICNP